MITLSIVIKATIIALSGLGAAAAARKARASLRHLVLAWTFAALLLIPMAFALVPSIAVPVQVSSNGGMVQTFSQAVAVPSNDPNNIPVTTEATSVALPAWSSVLQIIWAVGAGIVVLSTAITFWRLSRIRRRGVPWLHQFSTVRELAVKAGIRRPVDTLLHKDLETPLTYGFRRPMIMMPADAAEWSEADVHRALVHELEHVRRHDWTVHFIARIVCAFYWFHPLVWMAWRKLSVEAERACDDAVLQYGERADYADQLVQLARRLANANQPALAMANRSDLSTRVTAILSKTQRRGRAGALSAATIAASAVILAVGLAPLAVIGVPAEVQSGNRRLDRALLEAAEDGDLQDMVAMINAGANVNAQVDGDGSPLIAAARSGHIPAVQLLLERGADPNMGVSGDGNPLIMAAAEGRVNVVELLLNRGARIDEVVPGDENALIQASGSGHLPVVRLLVTRGADVNFRVWVDETYRGTGEWRTPLSMARRGRHDAVVAYLISAGARE